MTGFAVIVPLHDKGPHVAATLASIRAQTHQPREIIVIDDASTDDGPAIVRRLDDPLIKMLARTEPGPGGYAARNVGIEAATSEWIAFLDADDTWAPDHLANLHKAIVEGGESVGGAFSGIWIVDGDNRRPYRIATGIIRPERLLSLADIVRGWLASRDCPIWTGAAAFKRQVLIEAGLFPAGRARRGGDKDLWVRAAFRTTLVFAPNRTANFHQDTTNRVSNFTHHLDLPILVQTIADLLPRADPPLAALLKRLANRELGRYAKRTTKAGGRIPLAFFKSLYLPQGLAQAAYMMGLTGIRPFVRHVGAR